MTTPYRAVWNDAVIAESAHTVVGDKVSRDAAWYYPDPMAAAERIKDRIAFWRGVRWSLSQPRSLGCARAADGT